jgi:hypothetical protein
MTEMHLRVARRRGELAGRMPISQEEAWKRDVIIRYDLMM